VRRWKDMGILNEGVATIYKPSRAIFEASRCIECYEAPCVKACPARVDIPRFIAKIKMGDFVAANQVVKERCVFSGVCGLVCPVEKLCVKSCCITEPLGAVPINQLQRFVAFFELEHGSPKFVPPKSNEKKVGIVGAGPAGLAAAAELAQKGYQVTVFESKESPGGMMAYSIPSYRLPRKILEAEINQIIRMGVEIKTNILIKDGELLRKGYDAILISVGASEPIPLEVPGHELKGVSQGLEFLEKVSTTEDGKKKVPQVAGKRVAVIGGGDVAMDAAISAARLGARRTHLLYRRSFEEMPAIQSEVSLAKEQGVMFWIQADPKRIMKDAQKRVKGVECLEIKLGTPDKSGRRRPIPVKGTEFQLDVDAVIGAIGQKVDNRLLKTLGVATNPDGTLKVNEKGETSEPGIFAAGDVISGGATVIQAISEGCRVATSIDQYLKKV
jgi:glutamate synthase (NADPH/NADH) small chain